MHRIIVVVAVAGLIVGGCATEEEPLTEPDVSPALPTPAPEPPECVDRTGEPEALIEMEDHRFVPLCLEVTTAQGITNRNNGVNLHNFSVEGAPGVDVDTQPGQVQRYEPPGLDPGIYTFFCKYHRELGMQGELRIESG